MAGKKKLKKVVFKKFETTEVKKSVKAVKIETVINKKTGATLGFGKGIESIEVDQVFCSKHSPRAGGYYTVCKKGCKGYVSKQEFDNYKEVKAPAKPPVKKDEEKKPPASKGNEQKK